MEKQLALAFKDIISNPAGSSPLPAKNIYGNLSTTLYFSINIVYVLFYSALVIFVLYNITKMIYKISASDSSESYEKFSAGLTNAVFSVLGLAILYSIRFLLSQALQMIGVANADNVYQNLPF